MLTGRRFKLIKATIALEAHNGTRKAVTVPSDAILDVLSGPSREGDTGTVSVLWEGRNLAMFAIDIRLRGAEITDKSASV
jgi:hypothetical protein